MHQLNYLFYLSAAAALFLPYLPTGSTFQCSRHTSRYRDVASLTLTSSFVLKVKPVMTSKRNDVTASTENDSSSNICYVTVTVVKVFKNATAASNKLSQKASTADGGKGTSRLRIGFCMTNLEAGFSGENGNDFQQPIFSNTTDLKSDALPNEGTIKIGTISSRCRERVFPNGLDKQYFVFLDRTERVVNESRTDVEYVSLHRPVEANKENLREVNKLSSSKGRKPSARLEPDSADREFSLNVQPKSRLELKCRTSGTPAPEVEWIRNGDLIDSADKKYKIRNTKRGSRLRIAKAESTDCGEYYCRATNVLGESTSHSVYVSIGSEVSCPFQHKHPCPQQTYCLNGGTCWVLTSIGTEFCECKAGYLGERCAEKSWGSPVHTDPEDKRKIVSISIAALVFGATTILAVLVSVFLISRRCASKNRKKRYSRDLRVTANNKAYLKLVTDNTSSLPGPHKTQPSYVDDNQSLRDQGAQTVISMINSKVSPFIHVQIQSAIIHPNLDSPLSPPVRGLDQVDGGPRGRLSAISTTPGVDCGRKVLRHESDTDRKMMRYVDDDNNDDVGHHLEELGIYPVQGDDCVIPASSQNMSPLATLDELPRYDRLYQPSLSRYSGISSPVGSPEELLVGRWEEHDGKGLVTNEHQIESQKSTLDKSNLSNRSNIKMGSGSTGNSGRIRRNISNPDILESVVTGLVDENSYSFTHGGTQTGERELEKIRKDKRRATNNRANNDDTLHDSDPEATVV